MWACNASTPGKSRWHSGHATGSINGNTLPESIFILLGEEEESLEEVSAEPIFSNPNSDEEDEGGEAEKSRDQDELEDEEEEEEEA